ncbi:MAG: sensor histidine kinase [Pseudomonadota bacterium]
MSRSTEPLQPAGAPPSGPERFDVFGGRLRAMSLRSSLVLSIFVVVLVTLVFGAVLTYLHAQSKVAEEMQAAIVVGTRIAGNAVDDAEEWNSPQRRMVLLVADFHGDRHLRAKWLGPDGEQIMTSTPAAPSVQVPLWFESLIRRPELTSPVRLPSAFDGEGKFVLETDQRNEIGEVWNDSLNTLTILGVFCALILFFVNLVIAWALKPLSRLVAAFDDMSQAIKPPRVPESGPRDLVQVYAGFNAMSDKLSRIEAKNRGLNEQLQTVQEEERADLARDLHDEVGPFLFSVDVDAASIVGLLDDGRQDEIPARVRTMRDSIRHMQQHVRDLLGRLRSAALVDVGLEDAVENLIEFWQRRYPEIVFDVAILDDSFGEERDATIYRVVQESLSNAIRHGQPKHVAVEVVEGPTGIVVEVRNDGRPLPDNNRVGGYGISGMRERLAQLGGRVEVCDQSLETGAGMSQGVVVRAWLPSSVSSNEADQCAPTEALQVAQDNDDSDCGDRHVETAVSFEEQVDAGDDVWPTRGDKVS